MYSEGPPAPKIQPLILSIPLPFTGSFALGHVLTADFALADPGTRLTLGHPPHPAFAPDRLLPTAPHHSPNLPAKILLKVKISRSGCGLKKTLQIQRVVQVSCFVF